MMTNRDGFSIKSKDRKHQDKENEYLQQSCAQITSSKFKVMIKLDENFSLKFSELLK